MGLFSKTLNMIVVCQSVPHVTVRVMTRYRLGEVEKLKADNDLPALLNQLLATADSAASATTRVDANENLILMEY